AGTPTRGSHETGLGRPAVVLQKQYHIPEGDAKSQNPQPCPTSRPTRRSSCSTHILEITWLMPSSRDLLIGITSDQIDRPHANRPPGPPITQTGLEPHGSISPDTASQPHRIRRRPAARGPPIGHRLLDHAALCGHDHQGHHRPLLLP